MKTSTELDHKKRITRVVRHIEQNLDQQLDLLKLAELACMSPWHFHHIFSANIGESLQAHIKRLRLQRAATQLQQESVTVTRVALDCGFDTPSAFSRAFKNLFDCSPRFYTKKTGLTVRKALADKIQKEKNMEPNIKTIDTIPIIAVRKRGSYFESAMRAWGVLMAFAKHHNVLDEDSLLIGISHDDPGTVKEENLRYDACISCEAEIVPEGDVTQSFISGGRFAVFIHKGPHEKLTSTYNRIFATWVPQSGEQLAERPCFEIYLNRDIKNTRPEDLRTEIYVPLLS